MGKRIQTNNQEMNTRLITSLSTERTNMEAKEEEEEEGPSTSILLTQKSTRDESLINGN